MGTATSAATFFRTIGSCIGVAVFGAILTSQLAKQLALGVPATATGKCSAAALSGPSGALAQCPDEVQHGSSARTRQRSTLSSSRPFPSGSLPSDWRSCCPRFGSALLRVRLTPARRSGYPRREPRWRSCRLRCLATSAARTDCGGSSGLPDGLALILSPGKRGCFAELHETHPARSPTWLRNRRPRSTGYVRSQRD